MHVSLSRREVVIRRAVYSVLNYNRIITALLVLELPREPISFEQGQHSPYNRIVVSNIQDVPVVDAALQLCVKKPSGNYADVRFNTKQMNDHFAHRSWLTKTPIRGHAFSFTKAS